MFKAHAHTEELVIVSGSTDAVQIAQLARSLEIPLLGLLIVLLGIRVTAES